ncbi:MAG: hypothetical protein WD600_10460 [Pseudohongiella sp.]
MTEKYFNKLSTYLILLIVVFVLCQLLWEHLNGGVVSHYLLHRSDLPAISNWWGIVILPALAWFATRRIKKRIAFRNDDVSDGGRIPAGILTGFFVMLIVSLLQSVAFVSGYENITMMMALILLLASLFLPIYRAECVLGFVLGAAFTFGAVIPLIGILVIATISAVANLCIGPLLVNLWRRFKRTT